MIPVIALLLAAAAAPAPLAAPVTAQPQRDWTRVVAATPEGGFRMGNPNAAVKLVEFGSMVCPHCAHFAAEGMPAVLEGVKSGELSFEFRNYVLHPADIAAAMLARCQGTAGFFGATHRIYAGQSQWLDRLRAQPEATLKGVQALPPLQAVGRFALLAKLDMVAGMAPARTKQCLASQAELDRLVEMRRAASAGYPIHGTPSFLVNGKIADGVHDWAGLKPLLEQAGG